MVCCQAPVIVLFVPFVAEVAQDTAVGLPIDGFLLDVGVGIALLVPEGVFHSDVVRIEEVKTVVLLKALRGFVPFQHFFLGIGYAQYLSSVQESKKVLLMLPTFA